MRNLLFFSGLLLLAACADKAPPTWPGNASLEIDPTTDSARVSWPDPEDDHGVVRIVVRRGDEIMAELDGEARDYTLEHLTGETEISVSVMAEDEAGNRSERLSGTSRTLDDTAPHWPSSARVSHEDGILNWPDAVDLTGVVEYDVRLGDTLLATVSQTEHPFVPDVPEEETVDTQDVAVQIERVPNVTVVARDAAGNTSAPLALRSAPDPENGPAENEDIALADPAIPAELAPVANGAARDVISPAALRRLGTFGGQTLLGHNPLLQNRLKQQDRLRVPEGIVPE